MKLKHLLFLISSGSLLLSCGSKGDENGSDKNLNEAVPVTVSKAGLSGQGETISISGQLTSEHSAAISTRMMGYITKMQVKIGDNVRAGQLLFAIQSADIQAKGGQISANIAAADAALANAKKDYERFKILHQQNSATDKELENITLQYKAAEAQAQAARHMRTEVNANMDYANVTAPFSGTITQKLMDVGNLASPGMPVLMLESNGTLQAMATVTEDQIKYIRSGMHISVTIDANGRTINGIISQISKSSVATGGQYLIKVDLQNSNELLSGMYVHLVIPVSGDTKNQVTESVWIPKNSLVQQGDLIGIYTIGANHTATLRWLRTGKSTSTQIEVLSGLATGETYISNTDSRLWNGAKVKF